MVCNGSQICFAVFIELIKGLKNDESGEITKEKEMKKGSNEWNSFNFLLMLL